MFSNNYNLDKESILLGIDFGMSHIGLAIGQGITLSATPLKAINAKEGTPNWIEFDRIIKEWRPQAFVVGIPRDMDNNEQWIAKEAHDFTRKLKNRYQLPVHKANEQLTTKSAREKVFSRGGYKALQKADLDSIAAKLILEGWMSANIQ